MGLHICYELRLAGQRSDGDAAQLLAELRACALTLPVSVVSDLLQLTGAGAGG
jgi:hypothetical protein